MRILFNHLLKTLSNEWGCFGGKPSTPPAPEPVPAPPPMPVVTPSEVSAQTGEEARRKQLERLRYGLASTIKTKPIGLTGAGADLSAQTTGKTKLGA